MPCTMYHILYHVSCAILHIIIYIYILHTYDTYVLNFIWYFIKLFQIYGVSYVVYNVISSSMKLFYLLENLWRYGHVGHIHAHIGCNNQLLLTALPDVSLGHGDSARQKGNTGIGPDLIFPYIYIYESYHVFIMYRFI